MLVETRNLETFPGHRDGLKLSGHSNAAPPLLEQRWGRDRKDADVNDALLTPEETSEVLKVATQTLANWRSQGKGPSFVKLGARRCRYRRSEIERFIEAMTIAATN
jgi:predicted DNA-binding transcriptional regulator AlpA